MAARITRYLLGALAWGQLGACGGQDSDVEQEVAGQQDITAQQPSRAKRQPSAEQTPDASGMLDTQPKSEARLTYRRITRPREPAAAQTLRQDTARGDDSARALLDLLQAIESLEVTFVDDAQADAVEKHLQARSDGQKFPVDIELSRPQRDSDRQLTADLHEIFKHVAGDGLFLRFYMRLESSTLGVDGLVEQMNAVITAEGEDPISVADLRAGVALETSFADPEERLAGRSQRRVIRWAKAGG